MCTPPPHQAATAIGTVSRLLLIVVVALIQSNHLTARAQPGGLVAAPPASASTASGSVLRVFTAISVNLLEKVNGVEQSFLADFYLLAAYQEPKLLDWFPQDSAGFFDGTKLNDTVKDSIGFAELEFTNSVDVQPKYIETTYSSKRPPMMFTSAAYPDIPGVPWVYIDSRYFGFFRAIIELSDFPFDKQVVTVSLEWSNKDVAGAIFVLPTIDKNFLSNAPKLTEWAFGETSTLVMNSYYPVFDASYSRAHFNVTLHRNPSYYLNKIVTGVVVLVLLSAGTFSMDTHVADRAAISATAYLGVVTYLFVVTQDVPKVPYTTRLDAFISVSQMAIFANYLLQLVMMYIGSLSDDAIAEEEETVVEEEMRRQRADVYDAPPCLDARSDAQRQEGDEDAVVPFDSNTATTESPSSSHPAGDGKPPKRSRTAAPKTKGAGKKSASSGQPHHHSQSSLMAVSHGSEGVHRTASSGPGSRCARSFKRKRRYIDGMLTVLYVAAYGAVASYTLIWPRLLG